MDRTETNQGHLTVTVSEVSKLATTKSTQSERKVMNFKAVYNHPKRVEGESGNLWYFAAWDDTAVKAAGELKAGDKIYVEFTLTQQHKFIDPQGNVSPKTVLKIIKYYKLEKEQTPADFDQWNNKAMKYRGLDNESD